VLLNVDYRLWLFVKDPSTEPQQLGLLNKVPHKVETSLSQQGYHPYAGFAVGPLFLQTFGALMNTYEGFQETLQRLNDDLQRQPLQGFKIIKHSEINYFENVKKKTT
jgi:hypothetical protein